MKIELTVRSDEEITTTTCCKKLPQASKTLETAF